MSLRAPTVVPPAAVLEAALPLSAEARDDGYLVGAAIADEAGEL